MSEEDNVSPLRVGKTIFDDGPGGVAPLGWNSSLYDTDTNSSDYLNFDKPSGSSKQEARNYKCPNCEGEFNNWATAYRDGDGNIIPNHKVVTGASYRKVKTCPHCNMEKGEYNNEN
jgi:hypothetical protein